MTTNYEYYKVFFHVASTLSLTKAAEQLNISQPAVSQSIRQLENQLGVKLFQRAKHGVMLTKEGATLFEFVKEGVRAFEGGERAVKEMLDVSSGEIVIGASDMTLRFFLLPYLEKFHEEYPNIKITVTNAPTPETLENLKERTIDFGVISTPFDADDRISVTKVREITDTFVAGRRFIKYKNKSLDLKDIESLPIIFLQGETASRRYMEQFLATHNVSLKPEFELATSDMIVQFALKSLGIGCVMRDFASEYIEDGTLFELRFRTPFPKRYFCLAVNESATLSTAASKLVEMINKDVSDAKCED